VKFIGDAQLPVALATWIRGQGHDVVHTDDFPDKERTTDTQIRLLAHQENRIVISKDSDFLDSHLITQSPTQLLWVATGNIRNQQLLLLFEEFWVEIERNFVGNDLLELNNACLVVH